MQPDKSPAFPFPEEEYRRINAEYLKNSPIKALVRKVALHQCGHWMMGTARIHGRSITVSGSYGGDGLPLTVPWHLYERFGVKVPDELVEAWDKGGGWNSCGTEAPLMRDWALKTFKEDR
jgi:hypothetical protein